MLKTSLLEILVCPESKQRLTKLETSRLALLNEQIARGELKNRAGNLITAPIEEALVREDGQFAYVVRDEIPVMLVEEGIQLN